MKKDKRTNNDLQNTTQNTKDQILLTPLKTVGEHRVYRDKYVVKLVPQQNICAPSWKVQLRPKYALLRIVAPSPWSQTHWKTCVYVLDSNIQKLKIERGK